MRRWRSRPASPCSRRSSRAPRPTRCCSRCRRACATSAAWSACARRSARRCARSATCVHTACAATAQGAAILSRVEPPPQCTDLAATRLALQAAPVWLLGPGREHWEALQGMGLQQARRPAQPAARRAGAALRRRPAGRARPRLRPPARPARAHGAAGVVREPARAVRPRRHHRAGAARRGGAARAADRLAGGAARVRAPLPAADAPRGALAERPHAAGDGARDRPGRAVARQRPPAAAAARAAGPPAAAGADPGASPPGRRHHPAGAAQRRAVRHRPERARGPDPPDRAAAGPARSGPGAAPGGRSKTIVRSGPAPCARRGRSVPVRRQAVAAGRGGSDRPRPPSLPTRKLRPRAPGGGAPGLAAGGRAAARAGGPAAARRPAACSCSRGRSGSKPAGGTRAWPAATTSSPPRPRARWSGSTASDCRYRAAPTRRRGVRAAGSCTAGSAEPLGAGPPQVRSRPLGGSAAAKPQAWGPCSFSGVLRRPA